MYGVVDDYGAVAAPTDVFGQGAAMASTFGQGAGARAMVGGPDFDQSGFDNVGYTRIATGFVSPDAVAGPSQTTWRSLFDFEHNPTFWLLVFLLAAIGFVHARVALGGQVGPAHAGVTGGF